MFICILVISFLDAAEDLRTNRKNFEYNVKQSMRGKDVKGVPFDNVLM